MESRALQPWCDTARWEGARTRFLLLVQDLGQEKALRGAKPPSAPTGPTPAGHASHAAPAFLQAGPAGRATTSAAWPGHGVPL